MQNGRLDGDILNTGGSMKSVAKITKYFVATLLLATCAMLTLSAPAQAETFTATVPLASNHIWPDSTTGYSGAATFVVNTDDKTIAWQVTATGPFDGPSAQLYFRDPNLRPNGLNGAKITGSLSAGLGALAQQADGSWQARGMLKDEEGEAAAIVEQILAKTFMFYVAVVDKNFPAAQGGAIRNYLTPPPPSHRLRITGLNYCTEGLRAGGNIRCLRLNGNLGQLADHDLITLHLATNASTAQADFRPWRPGNNQVLYSFNPTVGEFEIGLEINNKPTNKIRFRIDEATVQTLQAELEELNARSAGGTTDHLEEFS